MKEKTSLALTHELFHLMQQIPRLRPRQDSTDGLTPSEQALLVMLLLNLDVTKKAATVTEIGNLLQITPAGVTHLLNPLEEIGYIERLHDRSDRRIVRISVTARAKRAARAYLGQVEEQLSGLIKHLGEEDSRTLIRLLSRAIQYFKADSGSLSPSAGKPARAAVYEEQVRKA